MHNYKELNVWKKSIELAVDIYKAMSQMPQDEKFGLVMQIKRCCISISSNIAEGAGRKSAKEFKQFLNISQGSAFELETQLIISNRLQLLNEDIFLNLVNKTIETQKMLYALEKSIVIT